MSRLLTALVFLTTACGAPPTNGELARTFYATFDQRPFDPRALRDLFDPAYVDHDRPAGFPDELSDRDALVGLGSALVEGFPDSTHRLDLLHDGSEGLVTAYWTFTGTNTGTFFGQPPTSREVGINGIDVLRFSNGKVVEQWHVEELADLERQLAAP